MQETKNGAAWQPGGVPDAFPSALMAVPGRPDLIRMRSSGLRPPPLVMQTSGLSASADSDTSSPFAIKRSRLSGGASTSSSSLLGLVPPPIHTMASLRSDTDSPPLCLGIGTVAATSAGRATRAALEMDEVRAIITRANASLYVGI